MPWANLETPSLGLSVLKPVAEAVPGVSVVDVKYGNRAFMEFIARDPAIDVTIDQYTDIAEGYFAAAGEWIFSGVLNDEPDLAVTAFYQNACQSGTDLGPAPDLFNAALPFVEFYAETLLDDDYDIYGFSSSFLQNAPSLALAKTLKTADPSCRIVFGGANCDGVQGAALHRNFPFVDYVVRGEGDCTFGQLLTALCTESNAVEPIAGLCWRDPEGMSRANPMDAPPLSMSRVAAPSFGDFFSSLSTSPIKDEIEPFLVIEGSRGCWWGEKHHCTFCGLNGTLMEFRSKSGDRLYAEILDAARTTRVLDIAFADNILDQAHLRDVMPMLQDADLDLRFFCEVKSNITYSQVIQLANAGVVQIQPGIENLSSRVLGLMRKGVTGVRNVELMRNCETVGVEVSWNYLYGFPGETADDYDVVLRQSSALVHLQPPSSAARVALERFSPYFEQASLGLRNTGPSKLFSSIFKVPDSELHDLIYLFESELAGLTGPSEQALRDAITQWKRAYSDSSLVGLCIDGHVVIEDRRHGWAATDHILGAGLETATYLSLAQGRSLDALVRNVRNTYGIDAHRSDVDALLESWTSKGLIFHDDDDRFVALATGSDLMGRR